MANEKRNDQIIDKNELSDQELEQATGGVTAAAALEKADRSRAAVNHQDATGRR